MQKKVKTYSTLNKPWISLCILKSIHHINSLYRNYLKNKQGKYSPFEKFKNYKNKLTHIIKIAKKIQYDNKLDYVKNNIKNPGKL